MAGAMSENMCVVLDDNILKCRVSLVRHVISKRGSATRNMLLFLRTGCDTNT